MKDELLQQAKDINQLLDEYIKIHNVRLKSAGSFGSLLKNIFLGQKVNFEEIYKGLENLVSKFDKKQVELEELIEKYGKAFSEQEESYYKLLVNYFDALFNTVKSLSVLAKRQYETSRGDNTKLGLQEDLELEKSYKNSILVYQEIGYKLNFQYNQLNKSA